jgi:hypothetical protein
MHGLNTIIKINKIEQDFIDHVLSTPIKDVNLLDVWYEWKQEQARELVSHEQAFSNIT